MRFHGIIPARFASSRFPGKPLALIAGRPMFWHVASRAARCPLLAEVVLATDDGRIADEAARLGIRCVMTRPDHACGTDRVYEAALAVGVADDDVVVNIQGDEPMLDPMLVTELLAPFSDPEVSVTTPVCDIPPDRVGSPNQVKVVTDLAGNALYFSRSPIPCVRDAEDAGKARYLGHIGLYAFRMSVLRRFVSLPQGRLERLEKLEQLRLLENGIPVRTVVTARHVPGVDTPEDLERVRAAMEGGV